MRLQRLVERREALGSAPKGLHASVNGVRRGPIARSLPKRLAPPGAPFPVWGKKRETAGPAVKSQDRLAMCVQDYRCAA